MVIKRQAIIASLSIKGSEHLQPYRKPFKVRLRCFPCSHILASVIPHAFTSVAHPSFPFFLQAPQQDASKAAKLNLGPPRKRGRLGCRNWSRNVNTGTMLRHPKMEEPMLPLPMAVAAVRVMRMCSHTVI
jgi:hypothetical protein